VFARSGSTWRQQGAKLLPPAAVAARAPDSFGSSVALAANGATALVGGARAGAAAGHDGPPGAAWVFTRSSAAWKQQGPALAFGAGVGSVGGVAFGQSVALTPGADTALIGGPGDAGDAGAVWMFKHG
jgi:hypothetical protein